MRLKNGEEYPVPSINDIEALILIRQEASSIVSWITEIEVIYTAQKGGSIDVKISADEKERAGSLC